jgi:hypothetical protein
MYQRVGQPQVGWALREIVRALGSPVTRDADGLLPPDPPPGAEGWGEEYTRALQPWRTKRAERLVSDDPRE